MSDPTAGNWHVEHGTVMSDARVQPADAAVPVCHLSLAFKSSEEMEANGRLICAAKEMLAALRKVAGAYRPHSIVHETHFLVAVHAAIAATGQGGPS